MGTISNNFCNFNDDVITVISSYLWFESHNAHLLVLSRELSLLIKNPYQTISGYSKFLGKQYNSYQSKLEFIKN